MTEKRFTLNSVMNFDYGILDNGESIGSLANICDLLNALHEDLETHKQYCKTLGIGINKIMQSIKDNKEDKALVMCLTLLKKLEEEDLLK